MPWRHLSASETDRRDQEYKTVPGIFLINAMKPSALTIEMGRSPRTRAADRMYHVLNRGNARMRWFDHEGDYAAERVLAEGSQRMPMRIVAHCMAGP